MASKFRLNRYNWFGQKLLTQHQYGDIIKLRQYLTTLDEHETKPTSEYLNYIHGLALMKTSTRLDEVIFSLQRLNFDKNNQYFLLLCQCLLYLGNYDSVVALCKQVIKREIDAVNEIGQPQQQQQASEQSQVAEPVATSEPTTIGKLLLTSDFGGGQYERRELWLDSVQQESFEFKKVFTNINRNQLINEPRLWFIFGLCLEYQHQFKDAYFAYKVASKLSLGSASQFLLDPQNTQDVYSHHPTSMSNYYAPHTRYAEFCTKYKADFKSAIHILSQAIEIFPQNYTMNPLLALTISAQPMINNQHTNFFKAIEIISSLESHSVSNRNPSLAYNSLALRCKRKLQKNTFLDTHCSSDTGDENRQNLSYLLIKCYIMINSIVQDSNRTLSTTRLCHLGNNEMNDYQLGLVNQLDKLLETLKNSDATCWASASLWNNLGVCYLMKKRFIACLSCLMKAYQINPMDWRINYNLSVACVHVGLVAKALICLLAARNLYAAQSNCFPFASERRRAKGEQWVDPLITSLLAVCYDKLGEVDEARRLHIGTTRPQKGTISSGVPIGALVNYLVFLHKNSDPADEQHAKLKLHLLDQLEQSWLQRNQNDPQFNSHLLDVARRIGEETSVVGHNPITSKKTYAWTKSYPFVTEQ